jgi:pentatricopeptide repeat protein
MAYAIAFQDVRHRSTATAKPTPPPIWQQRPNTTNHFYIHINMSIPMILLAASVSVSAFQGYHGDRPPRHGTSPLPHQRISRTNTRWNSPLNLSSTDRDVSKATTSFLTSIETLLEAGNVDDAVFELRNQEKEGTDVAPSSYHAIIEACCAGGGGGSEKKRYKQQKGNAKGKNGRDRIELAAELLQSMNPSTPHAYEIVISGYGRRGRWSDANNLLQQMEDIAYSKSSSKDGIDATSVHDCVPSLNVYQTVLTALAQGGQYDKVMSLLTKMRRRQVRPNVYTYNSLLNICAKDRTPRWKEALSLLSQCQREPGINPDLVTYTTAMRACAQARKSNKAMEIFRVINDMGMELDVYCYTTAMDACAKDRNWKTALKLLEDMTVKGVAPNEFTYSVAITACGNGGQWAKALELLDTVRWVVVPVLVC